MSQIGYFLRTYETSASRGYEAEYGEKCPAGAGFPRLALDHAAFIETSLMMYLHPELVSAHRAPSEIADFPVYDIYPANRDNLPASGSLAPVIGASAERSEQILSEELGRLLLAMNEAFSGHLPTL
ncbi:creatininase family protein [Mycobacterium sp. DL99]|uniref:creatininase family protein n=1 Tax=Mycobacterium sp. DL99 TaxID=2528957 RepID=UPI001081E264|nr:creatininase family protein [Mycobacterium sp. DL99]